VAANARRPVQNRQEIETYIASRPPVELNLAISIVKRMVVVGPVMIGLFAVVNGVSGMTASAAGVVIVAMYYLFTGWILSATARVSLATYYAGALFGFLVRLVFIGVTMVVLARQFDMDRVALGATVAVTYVALLMWETATMPRGSQDRERNSARQRMGDRSRV